MQSYLQDNILYISKKDLPEYKKNASIVRNNYFWALKSISAYSPPSADWEFESEVWFALSRMLLFFTNSGYLGYSETILEFSEDTMIPDVLRQVSTKL